MQSDVISNEHFSKIRYYILTRYYAATMVLVFNNIKRIGRELLNIHLCEIQSHKFVKFIFTNGFGVDHSCSLKIFAQVDRSY